MIRQKRILLFLFAQSLMISCHQRDSISQETLVGKWDITDAMRNGKETPYLRNGYFVFEDGSKIIVNIDGADVTSTYELNKQVIRTKDAREFVLQRVQPDSMTIHFVANPQNEFVFFLVKHHEVTQ